MSDAIHSGGSWYAHVFHNNGSGSFSTYVSDARIRRTEQMRTDFRIESAGFVGATEEISASVAGVPLTSEGLRELMQGLASACNAEKQTVFAVLGCADRREILVLIAPRSLVPPDSSDPFSPAALVSPEASDLTLLQLVFDAAGSKLDRSERVLVRHVQRATEGLYTRWTCRFADDRGADVWIHNWVMCGNGMDLRSRARIGDADYGVAGGLVETALRGY
jgi:hypothetical protein